MTNGDWFFLWMMVSLTVMAILITPLLALLERRKDSKTPKRCGTCRYAVNPSGMEDWPEHECHRKSPGIRNGGWACWPRVQLFYWCGLWEEKS